MDTRQAVDAIGHRKFPLSCALAGGIVGSAVRFIQGLCTQVNWSPPYSSAGGWFESPQLDSLNDAFNRAADIIVWFLSAALRGAAGFVGFGLVLGLLGLSLTGTVRLGQLSRANFRWS